MLKLYTLDNKFIKKVHHTPNDFTGIVEWHSGTKCWGLNGILHRINGPAVEYADGTKQWWLNDKQMSEEQHKLLVDMMKLKGLISNI